MSGRPRPARWKYWAPLVAVVGLVAVATSATTAASAGAIAPVVGPAVGSGCAGAKIPMNLTGHLEVLAGGGPGPSVASVPIGLNYSYTLNYTPRGGNLTLSCIHTTTQNLTNASGFLELHAAIPTSGCTAGGCAYYSGPFGPPLLTLAEAAPAGYFWQGEVVGATVTAAFVEALSTVSVTPAGPLVVSALDPIALEANASAGNGAPSPAQLDYAWTLLGSGWTAVGPTDASVVTVEAGNTSGPLRLELQVGGSFGGVNVSAPTVSVNLTALRTAVTSTGVDPPEPEVGLAVVLSVNGTGAPGYPYWAKFDPGLGLPTSNASCALHPTPGDNVLVGCTTTVTYAGTGIARPAVSLTNGFSSTQVDLAPFDVAPMEGLAITPDPLLAYAGAPSHVAVYVVNGTGVAPFGPACLWSGSSTPSCQVGGPGRWDFPVVFGSSGTFAIRATLEDATGMNRSTAAAADVVVRPSLQSIVESNRTLAAGSSMVLSAVLTGGGGPFEYWWNDSTPAGTLLSGTAQGDGPLYLDYASGTPGVHTVTLTVADQLGTIVAAQVQLDVLDGPARSLTGVGPTPSTTVAGAPLTETWRAIDGFGRPLSVFSETLGLSRTAEDSALGPVWVNASGASETLTTTNPSAEFGESAWSNGTLTFSIAATSAGRLVLALGTLVPVSAAPQDRLVVQVLADGHHPRLVDPRVVQSDGRSSSTLYRVLDPFGNPVTSGYVVVRAIFGSVESEVDSAILTINGSAGAVWVNVSAPNADGGTVYVLSEYGEPLLTPISVPPASDLSPTTLVAVGVGLAGAAVAVGALVWSAVRRRRATGPRTDPDEADLRRVAEGRAAVLSACTVGGTRTREELQAATAALHPDTGEFLEWLGGLVADGSLVCEERADGTPVYVRTPDPAEPARWRIEFDPAALRPEPTDMPSEEEPCDSPGSDGATGQGSRPTRS